MGQLCANPLSTLENSEDGVYTANNYDVCSKKYCFVDNFSAVIDQTFNFKYTQAKHAHKYNLYI